MEYFIDQLNNKIMQGEQHYLFSILNESNVIILSQQKTLVILINSKGFAYVKIMKF